MRKYSEVYDVMWDTYGDTIEDKDVKEFNILIIGAEQYGVDTEMIEFSKNNPDATLKELWEYFHSITKKIEYTDGEDDE